MSRIANAYASKFRTVLQRLGARRVEDGVRWMLGRASQLSETEGLTPAHALARLYSRGVGAVHRRAKRQCETGVRVAPKVRAPIPEATPVPKADPSQPAPEPSRPFLCDAGLGGLARWLRAAGYEAIWIPEVDDDQLLHEAARRGAIILTTDSILMERRVLRDGVIPGVWVPPTFTMPEQLGLVLGELGLEPRESRCMSCGGELRAVEKEAVRKRIPPKTYLWRNEFFECARCGKLYWHGTHWENIAKRLADSKSG
jgi:uncharacterized protein